MAKAKRKEFQVEVMIKMLVGVTITAASLEEANEHAKEMDYGEFVTAVGDVNEWSKRLTGVYELGTYDEIA